MIAIAATPGDLETLAALAYRAFHDKPFHSWCFGEQKTSTQYAVTLQLHFLHALRSMLAEHSVYTTPSCDGLITWEVTPAGDATRFSVEPAGKPARYLEAIDVIHAKRPRHAHVYLDMLATDPLQQRKGIARSLISRMTEQASALQLPVYFETDSEINLSIYARLGFGVIDSFSPANGPLMWSLQST